MFIDDLLRSPTLKRAMAAGEERVGKLVADVLGNERVMHRVQTVVSTAVTAKSAFDRGVRAALGAVSLPSTEEVEELRRKLAELETMLDDLAEKVDRPDRAGRP